MKYFLAILTAILAVLLLVNLLTPNNDLERLQQEIEGKDLIIQSLTTHIDSIQNLIYEDSIFIQSLKTHVDVADKTRIQERKYWEKRIYDAKNSSSVDAVSDFWALTGD